ncbi:MAG: hypothetical protein KC478_02185 [Bacteriovoracaceae bacterium]|nr:hypothetical protein [Bacteriovoracaceae bacterium]
MSYPKLFKANENLVDDDRFPIGKILSIENDARLKKPFLFTWSGLNSDQGEVRHNDLIFTNESSIAKIELSKGQRITARPETLLRLKDQSLEIKNGGLELDLKGSGKELKIIVGDNSFTLNPLSNSKVTISSVAGQGKFQVSQGSINIKTESIDVQANAGEEVLAGAATVSKAQAQLKLLSPVDTTLLLSPSEKVSFKVENALETASIKVTNLDNQRTLSTSLEGSLELTPGEYSWQVISDRPISHKAFFSVKAQVQAPKLVSPRHLEEIVFYDQKPSALLKWDSSDNSILEVSDQFQNIFFSENLDSNSKQIEFSSEGQFDWKVKVDSKLTSSPWSSTRSVIVSRLDYQQGDVAVIELKRPDQLAKFDWEGVSVGKFILSKSRDLKNVIFEKSITDQKSIEVPVGNTGVYYWKLVGDQASSFRPKKVIIRPTPAPTKPASPPKIELKLRPKKQTSSSFSIFSNAYASEFESITITFPEIENAKEYEIEIYSDQNLKNLIEKVVTTSPSFNWTPPRAGSYTWRLRYKDHWNRWSPYSDSSMIAAKMEFIQAKKKKVVKKAKIKRPRRKPVRKKIVKKSPVRKKKRVRRKRITKRKPKKRVYSNHISAFYAPSLVSYESEKDQSIKIDGNALGGHAFSWYQKTSYPIRLDYSSSYGSVFESESFVSRSLSLSSSKGFKMFNLGASVMFNQISDYELSGASVISSDDASSVGLGLVADSAINIGTANALNVIASAHFVGLTHLSLSLSYDYPYKKRLYFETILKSTYLKTDTDGGNISSQTFQLLVGPKYKF